MYIAAQSNGYRTIGIACAHRKHTNGPTITFEQQIYCFYFNGVDPLCAARKMRHMCASFYRISPTCQTTLPDISVGTPAVSAVVLPETGYSHVLIDVMTV